MPNPTDTLYAPPLPPLGSFQKPPKPSMYFDDVVAAKPSSPSLDGYAHYLQKKTPPKAPPVRQISVDEARGALLRTIVARPRRVNPTATAGGCLNTSLGSPSHHCVAAQALVELGCPLPSTDHVDNGGGVHNLSSWLRSEHGITFDSAAIELLGTAQAAADADANSPDPDGWLLVVGRALTRY